jgi:pantoate--beta-alanine ligase
MRTVKMIKDLFSLRAGLAGSVGLVPTMGFLHQGHLSLIERALAENDHVIVTIFVNPSQFGPNEDLARYPRDLEADLQKIGGLGDCIVWLPEADEMYPGDFQTWVNVENLTAPLEGAIRPGHFRGVTTIVAKLFNATQPNRAYFGQKDIQQVTVISQMVKDLNYPIGIVVCPTVREADGLAMSSRNTYLTPQQRAAAPVIYRSLRLAEAAFAAGERDAAALLGLVEKTISAEPLAMIQYVACTDRTTLQAVDVLEGSAVISLAVHVGSTRLIDNIILG